MIVVTWPYLHSVVVGVSAYSSVQSKPDTAHASPAGFTTTTPSFAGMGRRHYPVSAAFGAAGSTVEGKERNTLCGWRSGGV